MFVILIGTLGFPSASVENLSFFGSDRRPVSLILKPDYALRIKKFQKRFTFEHKWIVEKDFTYYFMLSLGWF